MKVAPDVENPPVDANQLPAESIASLPSSTPLEGTQLAEADTKWYRIDIYLDRLFVSLNSQLRTDPYTFIIKHLLLYFFVCQSALMIIQSVLAYDMVSIVPSTKDSIFDFPGVLLCPKIDLSDVTLSLFDPSNGSIPVVFGLEATSKPIACRSSSLCKSKKLTDICQYYSTATPQTFTYTFYYPSTGHTVLVQCLKVDRSNEKSVLSNSQCSDWTKSTASASDSLFILGNGIRFFSKGVLPTRQSDCSQSMSFSETLRFDINFTFHRTQKNFRIPSGCFPIWLSGISASLVVSEPSNDGLKYYPIYPTTYEAAISDSTNIATQQSLCALYPSSSENEYYIYRNPALCLINVIQELEFASFKAKILGAHTSKDSYRLQMFADPAVYQHDDVMLRLDFSRSDITSLQETVSYPLQTALSAIAGLYGAVTSAPSIYYGAKALKWMYHWMRECTRRNKI